MLYQTGLPEPKFFTTRGLLGAPDPNEIVRRVKTEDDRRGEVVDRVVPEMGWKICEK